MKKIIKKIINQLFPFVKLESEKVTFKQTQTSMFSVSEDSIFRGQDQCRIVGSITENSTFIIEEGASVSGKITISGKSTVIIGKNSSLINVQINIKNGVLKLSEGVIFDSERAPSHIVINNGEINIDNKVHCKSNLLARFGGVLSIGEFSDLGEGTEIRCEEKISIGKFCLFSYNIHIYDTNTHNVDWEYRRQRVIAEYPNCAEEIHKPETKPVIIGDDVWIGQNVAITKGVVIGNRCVIGINTTIGSGVFEDDTTIVCEKPRRISKH